MIPVLEAIPKGCMYLKGQELDHLKSVFEILL